MEGAPDPHISRSSQLIIVEWRENCAALGAVSIKIHKIP